MKSPSLRTVAGFCAALPVLILFLWVGRLYLKGAAPLKIVRLPIVGVDPRDLISGHYFTYRIDFGFPVNCTDSGPQCLCIEGPPINESQSGLSVVTEQLDCEKADKECQTNFLRGNCEDGKFVTGLDRYFFDERHKEKLAIVPEGASISINLDEEGKPTLKEVFVNDMTLGEWLKLDP